MRCATRHIAETKLRILFWQNRYRCYHPDAWNSFLSLRLLSRQMSDLVVPVSYREIHLGRGILECFITCFKIKSETASERSRYLHTPEIIRAQYKVAEYVRTYTQHVLITDEDLAWAWLPDMLSHLTNLKHLTCVLRLFSIS